MGGYISNTKSVEESILSIILYGGQLWFLYSLFIVAITYPFIHKIIKHSPKYYLIVIAVAFVLTESKIEVELFTIHKLTRYFVYYVLGQTFSEFKIDIFHRKERSAHLCTIISCILLILLAFFPLDWLYVLPAVIGIILSIGLSYRRIFVKCFKRLGRITQQIYLLNSMIIMVSRTVAGAYLHITNPYIIFGINFACGFWGSLIVIEFLIKRIRVLRFLYGMK